MVEGNGRKTIVVLGATGHQGGAVARELARAGFHVKAVTRNPSSVAAAALSALGCHIVQADISNSAAMSRALEDAWGAYCVLTMAEMGAEWEKEQGILFAETAKKEGVEQIVYSSVASADRDTGIPHFESKRRIEEKIWRLKFTYATVIRPVSFMENILSPRTMAGLEKGALIMGLDPGVRHQLIAVDDIGRFGALPFEQPEMTRDRTIEIAGDELTVEQMAKVLSVYAARPVKPAALPIGEMRRTTPDLAAMAEWMDRVGYKVDIAKLKETYGIIPVTFEEWVKKVRWPFPVN